MKSGFLLLLMMPFLLIPILGIPRASEQSTAVSYTQSVPGLIWATWGGKLNDTGSDVAIDRSGNSYVIGSTQSFGSGSTDAVLLKYDPNGTLLWARTWGGVGSDVGKALAVDPSDGRVYIAGDTQSFGNGFAISLVKFDPNGYLIWQRTYEGTNTTHVADVAIDYSGNAFLTGETSAVQGNPDLFLLKVNILGSIVWQRSWGGNSTDKGNGLVLDSGGGVYVTGFTQSLGPNRAGVILKFGPDGSLLWQRAWNGTKSEEGVKLAVDSSDAIYLAGNTSSYGSGSVDVLLMKLNSTGGVLWDKAWGGNGTNVAQGIGVDVHGNIFASGYMDQTAPCSGEVPLLLKLNASFVVTSLIMSNQYCYGSLFLGHASGLAVDASGNAIATGFRSVVIPSFSNGSKTLSDVSLMLKTTQFSIAMPTLHTEEPAGTVSSPMGSQDQIPYDYYSTHENVLLLKYFANPATFAVKYGYGSVFENMSFQVGTYFVRYGIPLCPCSEVAGWRSRGGVTIVSVNFVSGSEVVVFTVTGPGILQFPVYEFDYYPYQSHSALPLGLLLVAVMLMLPVVFLLRRRQLCEPIQR